MQNYLTRGVDWNNVTNPLDSEIWNRLTANFWLPEKIPLANDLKSWNLMGSDEKTAVTRVFAGLTLLDSIQASVGAPALMSDARTQHEEAVFANISFMEAVHAKSYSQIFATLNSSEEIDDAFDWSEANDHLQKKAQIMQGFYHATDESQKKVASTMLESFLFYSGFYLPLYYSSKGKITNTADIIRLILRDESVHGYYIGQLYQQRVPKDQAEELEDFTYDLLSDLMSNEIKYAQSLYDPIGLTEDVTKFMRYNANKALMNLGYDGIYSKEQTACNPAVMTGLDLSSENHDFFSGSGSSYSIIEAEDTTDDDWDF